MAEEALANLTHHQNITDAILTSMGETMALQQALLQVPSFDGKNMPLKSFLQDVESGQTLVPQLLMAAYFRGVCSKLRDIARDAVTDKNINSLEALTAALKEYFAAKKSYPQYCADIQAVRMRQNEKVISYYNRIRKIRSSAVSSLKESFQDAEIVSMEKMLDGLALESFKRGLPDDLIYGVSVQNPNSLEDAYKIALRLEEDLKGSTERNSNYLRFAQTEEDDNNTTKRSPRLVSFQDEERRDSIPFRMDHNDTRLPRRISPNRLFNRDLTPPRDNRNHGHYDFPKMPFGQKHDGSSAPFMRRSRSPSGFHFSHGYYPPMPYQPFPPYPYQPFVPGMYPPYPHYPSYPNNYNPNNMYSRNTGQSNSRSSSPYPYQDKSESLNSQGVRQTDVETNKPNEITKPRPSTVKFLTIQNMSDGQEPKEKHQ